MDKSHWLELKIPPLLLLLVMLVMMYVISMLMPQWQLHTWISSAMSAFFWIQSVLAMGLMILAIVIGLSGVVAFRQAKTTVDPTNPSKSSQVVCHGIYRYSRNPMYLGMLILLLSWSVLLGNVLSLIALPLFVLYMNRFQIMAEERILTQRFGREYSHYLSQVKRWI